MKYAVQVNYRTHRGNASSRTFVVEANSEPEAVEIANGKARKHPNVQSIVGGDVVEVFSPAPTDWGKELSKIQDLREKAIAEIAAIGTAVRFPMVSIHSRSRVKIEGVCPMPDGKTYVTLSNGRLMYVSSLNTEAILAVLIAANKAIAGGMGK